MQPRTRALSLDARATKASDELTGSWADARPLSPKLPKIDTAVYCVTSQASSCLSGSTAADSPVSSILAPQSAHDPRYRHRGKAGLSPLRLHLIQHNETKRVVGSGPGHGTSPATSPVTIPPPPLSARTKAFIFAVQQGARLIVNVLERYLRSSHRNSADISHRARSQSSPLPPLTPYIWLTKPHTCQEPKPLTDLRRALLITSLTLLVVAVALSSIIAHYIEISWTSPILIMGMSAIVTLFAATGMAAARRSLKEILAMAALSATVCQCLMGHMFHDR